MTSTQYRFGAYQFDQRSGDLTGPTGTTRLQPQTADLLALLLERAGEIVSREDIQNRIWPSTIVDYDHGINFCIRRLRVALSDSAENPRFIETIPKRGYRFLVPVEQEPIATLRAHPQSLWRQKWPQRGLAIVAVPALLFLALRMTAPSGPTPPVLAVFTHSVATDSALMEDALMTSHSITSALVNTFDQTVLRVVGPAGTTDRPAGVSANEFAQRQLQACLTVSGSMTRVATGVFVFTQIIRTFDQAHLWARNDTLATDIAATVAGTLRDAIGSILDEPPCEH